MQFAVGWKESASETYLVTISVVDLQEDLGRQDEDDQRRAGAADEVERRENSRHEHTKESRAPHDEDVPEKTHLSVLSAFPMFVPSLAW